MIQIPTRIQRKREKGWKNPPFTRYCGRRTRYGNPYKIGGKIDRVIAMHCFAQDIEKMISENGKDWFIENYLHPLSQFKHLSCFCPLEEICHVDQWIEYVKFYWNDIVEYHRKNSVISRAVAILKQEN